MKLADQSKLDSLPNFIEGQFLVDNVVTVVTVRPYSLLSTIGEIGGILAFLLKVSIIFSFIHQRRFEYKMRLSQNTNELDFKKVFTFNNFNQALSTIKEL